MPTAPLNQLAPIAFEVQSLGSKLMVIEDNQDELKKSLDALAHEQALIKKLVVTGNGEISLLERFRNIDRVLADHIAGVEKERAERKTLEAEERRAKVEAEAEDRKAKRDAQQRLYGILVALVTSAVAWYIGTSIVHLVQALP